MKNCLLLFFFKCKGISQNVCWEYKMQEGREGRVPRGVSGCSYRVSPTQSYSVDCTCQLKCPHEKLELTLSSIVLLFCVANAQQLYTQCMSLGLEDGWSRTELVCNVLVDCLGEGLTIYSSSGSIVVTDPESQVPHNSMCSEHV